MIRYLGKVILGAVIAFVVATTAVNVWFELMEREQRESV